MTLTENHKLYEIDNADKMKPGEGTYLGGGLRYIGFPLAALSVIAFPAYAGETSDVLTPLNDVPVPTMGDELNENAQDNSHAGVGPPGSTSPLAALVKDIHENFVGFGIHGADEGEFSGMLELGSHGTLPVNGHAQAHWNEGGDLEAHVELDAWGNIGSNIKLGSVGEVVAHYSVPHDGSISHDAHAESHAKALEYSVSLGPGALLYKNGGCPVGIQLDVPIELGRSSSHPGFEARAKLLLPLGKHGQATLVVAANDHHEQYGVEIEGSIGDFLLKLKAGRASEGDNTSWFYEVETFYHLNSDVSLKASGSHSETTYGHHTAITFGVNIGF